MLDAVMAVIVVVAAAAASFAFQRWRSERERRDHLLKRYLAQLQDSCESFWYRLENLAFNHADAATDPEYLVTTTMYTMGRTLGIERMLALEGLYPEVWNRFPQLKTALGRRIIDSAVSAATKARNQELQHYDRVALAEAAVERHGDTFRPSTFLEFRHRVEGEGVERAWWVPARESVSALTDAGDEVKALMATLKELSVALSTVTRMETRLASEKPPRKAPLSGAKPQSPARSPGPHGDVS